MARFVSQTRFGGSKHPISEQGNCVQAAIASLLNIPLEEAFDAVAAYASENAGGPHWFHALEQWARERGMRVWWEEHALTGVMGLADVNSIDLPGDRHVVVARGLDIVHDPSPRYRERGVAHTFPEADPCFIYFMPLDPAEPLPTPEGRGECAVVGVHEIVSNGGGVWTCHLCGVEFGARTEEQAVVEAARCPVRFAMNTEDGPSSYACGEPLGEGMETCPKHKWVTDDASRRAALARSTPAPSDGGEA